MAKDIKEHIESDDFSNWEHHDKKHKGFKYRKYSSYEDYKTHQASKLSSLNEKDKKRQIARMRERIFREFNGKLYKHSNVLCLGARQGGEVLGFWDVGCFAVGIDLNPGEGTQSVLKGDFHNIQFPSDSVNIIYTNALDHALNIDKVIKECVRLLTIGGLLIVDIVNGEEEGYGPSEFEACWWKSYSDLIMLIKKHGLIKVDKNRVINVPWKGICAKFMKK